MIGCSDDSSNTLLECTVSKISEAEAITTCPDGSSVTIKTEANIEDNEPIFVIVKEKRNCRKH
jgi:hypothetical protein